MEIVFENTGLPAENFFLKPLKNPTFRIISKKILVKISFDNTTFVQNSTYCTESWEQTSSHPKIPIFCFNPPATHFWANSDPPTTENIAVLLRLLSLFRSYWSSIQFRWRVIILFDDFFYMINNGNLDFGIRIQKINASKNKKLNNCLMN